MEDAFYSLRLDRYVNAPDNRGWMNLFRRWGNAPAFQEHVLLLERTFSKQFIEFYRDYIEKWPDDVPVPHPWDVRAAVHGRTAALYAGSTQRGLERCASREGAQIPRGIFLDAGRREVGPPIPLAEPDPVRSGQHGHAGETAGGAAPAPVGPAVADSSGSTD
jgi:hypothetical protein